MQSRVGRLTIELVQGDITELDTDAIVNAANAQLQLGGGVAGAIRRKGGPSIQAECDHAAARGPIRVGEAAITGAGQLKAKHVIHAVGPRMGMDTPEDELLANATRAALKLAEEHGLKSIAFPAISTGIFGYPIRRCAVIMVGTTVKHLKGKTGLERVVFCLFTKDDCTVFEAELRMYMPGADR
jgi:O-acetyl-ADP-ribose deacetylase (regulator of RNase III)